MEKTTVEQIAAPPLGEPAAVDVEYGWYRAIYFILPLLITVVMYLVVEAKAKSLRIAKKPGN
jgi:hypothetical protein